MGALVPYDVEDRLYCRNLIPRIIGPDPTFYLYHVRTTIATFSGDENNPSFVVLVNPFKHSNLTFSLCHLTVHLISNLITIISLLY